MSDTPPDQTPAERWFRLAEEDLHAGRVLVAEGSAALLALSVNAPKIHGLRQLYGLLPTEPEPPVTDDDMDLLDPWVIDGRYAADLPDLSQTEAARLLDAAERIVDSARPTVEEGAGADEPTADTNRPDDADG